MRLDSMDANCPGERSRNLKRFLPSHPIIRILCCFVVMAGCCKAQTQDEICKALTDQTSIAFDIISIKMDTPDRDTRSQEVTPDAVMLAGYNLRSLIHFAFLYDIENIRGGPNWADRLRFDITAKVSEKDMAVVSKMKRVERRAMLSAVLCHSFGLQLSVDKKMEPGFYLVTDKHGSRLRTSATQGAQNLDDPNRGEVVISRNNISGRGVGIETLIRYLSQVTGRTVIDKTGLRGTYDFDLSLSSNDGNAKPSSDPEMGDGIGGSDSGFVFAAIKDQLGVKLLADKIPTDVLLIRSAKVPELN